MSDVFLPLASLGVVSLELSALELCRWKGPRGPRMLWQVFVVLLLRFRDVKEPR